MPFFMSDSNKDKAATIILRKMRGSGEYEDMKRMSHEGSKELREAEHEGPVDLKKLGLAAAAEDFMKAMNNNDVAKAVDSLKAFIQMCNDGSSE